MVADMTGSTTCVSTPFNTAVLTTTIIFVVLATVAVGLRFVASHKANGTILHYSDTWLILSALVLCYGYLIQTICAVALVGVNCYHRSIDTNWASQEVRKILWSDVFLVVPASALAKISILEFCKRIFVTKKCKWMCNSAIFLCSVWAISAVFAQGFSTTPLSASWNAEIAQQHTNYDYSAFALAIASINVALDFLVLAMPIPAIFNFNMPTAREVKILGIYTVGVFSLICSIVRLYYLERQLKYLFHNSGEEAKIASNVMLWGRMEPAIAIVAACLPTFGPLLTSEEKMQTMVMKAAARLSFRGSRNSKRLKGHQSWALKHSRSSTDSHGYQWPVYKEGVLPHHHASIHSYPRTSHQPAEGHQINVTNEFWVDRETTRDSGNSVSSADARPE